MKRTEGPQSAQWLLYVYNLGKTVWAEAISVEARGVEGQEASGTEFSPMLVKISEKGGIGGAKIKQVRHM